MNGENNNNNGFEFPNNGVQVNNSDFNKDNNDLQFETAHSSDPVVKQNEDGTTSVDMSLIDNSINDNNKEVREHSTFEVPTTAPTQPKANIDFPNTRIEQENFEAMQREQAKQELIEQKKSLLQKFKDLFKKKPGSR